MATPLLSSDNIHIIQESTEDDLTLHEVSSRTKRDFVHFMRDFGVLETAIGFIVASVLLDFIKSLINYTAIKYIGIKNMLFNNTISLIIITLLLYLFVKYVFYTHLYTNDVAKEEVIKKALAEKKVEIVKKKFDQHKNIKDALNRGSDISAMNNELYKESFTPKQAFAGLYNGYSL